MTSDPLVSVVVIFYNDNEFLGEAIQSVLEQTFTDWELLLVDDGSTDGSTDLARKVVAEHPGCVLYLDHPGHTNQGISATRNRGIKEARGRYVAFLDSDDVWYRDKLEDQVRILQAHPDVGLLVGASEYWWSWAGGDAPREDKIMQVGAESDRVHVPPSLLRQLYPLGKGVAPCPSSCIVSRTVLLDVGGFESHMPGLYDDQGFFTKAYLATPVWVSSRCWDRYRRHPGAVTLASSRDHYLEVRRYFLTWFREYVQSEGITDPDIQAALRRAWWPFEHPVLASWRQKAGVLRARLRRRLHSVRR